jgi:hypothetical protein
MLRRLALGISVGAFLGAVTVAGIIYALPENYKLNTTTAYPFVFILELVFGHLAHPPEPFLECAGATIGAVAGIFAVRIVPNPKMWLAFLAVFIVGILIGGAAIYRPGKQLAETLQAEDEDIAAGERASAYLNALRAVDRGATNQLYLANFQTVGRSVLSNYLHVTEEGMQNLKNREYPNSFFTNSAIYHIAQKYLATHTNSLPIGKDYEDSNLDITNSAPARRNSGH